MKQCSWMIITLLSLFLLGACATNSGPAIVTPNKSLLIGYIDMEDAPSNLERLYYYQVESIVEDSYRRFSLYDGLFYTWDVDTGSYYLASFEGTGLFGSKNAFTIPRQNKETTFQIKKPGLHFIGSFKYSKIKTGIFEQGKFSLVRVNKPTELELLERLLSFQKPLDQSIWGDKIRARIAELRR